MGRGPDSQEKCQTVLLQPSPSAHTRLPEGLHRSKILGDERIEAFEVPQDAVDPTLARVPLRSPFRANSLSPRAAPLALAVAPVAPAPQNLSPEP